MNVVVQEEPYGCGIASVANILGTSYSEVKLRADSLGISADDVLLYSDTGYVRNLLNSYGILTDSSEQPFKTWDVLPDECFLAINHRKQNDQSFWHWVVFKRENGNSVVMDSFMSIDINERYDFNNIAPHWFIEVQR